MDLYPPMVNIKLGAWVVERNSRLQITKCVWLGKSIYFFKKFFGGHTCPFLGPLVPLFSKSGDVCSGLPYSHCRGERNVHSPRSTSGATLADLLAAGVQPVLSP